MISMTMNIKAIKFSYGEECVCQVIEEQEDSFKIKNAIKCIPMPSPDGRGMKTVVLPFFDVAKQDAELIVSKQHIMCITEANDEISSFYYQQFSGISLPPEKKLIVPSV